MRDYFNSSKGSEWRKWDLHFHTPSSYDYKDKNQTNQDLINALVQKKISVVAVTDHHIIDVTRIKELQELGEKHNITVLPGIEFRAEMRGTEPIHFIAIFPEDSNIEHNWSEIYSKADIGKQKNDNKNDEEIYCDLKDTCSLVKELGGLLSIHAGKKSNSIEEITNALPHAIAQKKDIAGLIDIFELGKEADQDDYNNIVFPAIKQIKPMILCSDNHDAKNYSLKQNCWIKANPSFNGLKQTLYEPQGRVRIQEEEPERKTKYSVIDAVRFIDKSTQNIFDQKWIELNPNLNSIIGGKSSGKSLLIYHIAKTIDEERINSINNESRPYSKIEYTFEENDNFNFEVRWADGVTTKLKDPDKPNRAITFLPQLYLNRLAEDQKEELNRLVDKLLSDSFPEYQEFRKSNKAQLEDIKTEIFGVIDSYYKTKDALSTKEKELKELGDKYAIKRNLAVIKDKIENIRKESSFSPEEEKNYNELTKNIEEFKASITDTEFLISALEITRQSINSFKDDLSNELLDKINDNIKAKYPVVPEQISNRITEITKKLVAEMTKTIETSITNEFVVLKEEKDRLKALKADKHKAVEEIQEFAKIVKNQELFKKLLEEEESEKKKLGTISEKEKEIEKLKEKLTIDSIKAKYSELYKCYQDIVDKNKNYKSIPDTDNLTLESSIKINKKKFQENYIRKINKKKSLAQQFGRFFNEENEYLFNEKKHLSNTNTMIDKIIQGKVSLNQGFDEKNTIMSLLDDYFYIDYNLLQDGDDLIKMSPGKRGIILFQLFLHLSKSTNPILIDQPEDNLDNRTVYQELNDFIKAKKSKRQIIIVSHNPNLVVSTDSENIIVANQDGQNKSGKNAKFKFEYVNGAIELSYVKNSNKGILFQKGIRQHVCDILEGGEEAFEKRETKYGLK